MKPPFRDWARHLDLAETRQHPTNDRLRGVLSLPKPLRAPSAGRVSQAEVASARETLSRTWEPTEMMRIEVLPRSERLKQLAYACSISTGCFLKIEAGLLSAQELQAIFDGYPAIRAGTIAAHALKLGIDATRVEALFASYLEIVRTDPYPTPSPLEDMPGQPALKRRWVEAALPAYETQVGQSLQWVAQLSQQQQHNILTALYDNRNAGVPKFAPGVTPEEAYQCVDLYLRRYQEDPSVAAYIRGRSITAETLRELVPQWKAADVAAAKKALPGVDLDTIATRYGSAESLVLLISRLASRNRGQSLSVWTEIAKSMAAGTFDALKFGDARQMVGVPVEVWGKARVNVRTVEVSQPQRADEAAAIETTRALVQELARTTPHAAPTDAQLQAVTVMLTNTKRNPKQALADVAAMPNASVVGALLHVLMHSEQRETMRFAAQVLRVVAPVDATALAKALSVKTASKAPNLVVTVLSHDARTLLETGALVDAKSCHDYRTGGQIEALASYVIDANLQVMFSYVLTEAHFASRADLEKAKDSPATFDDNTRTLTFQSADGTRVTTKPLGKALYRQVIKLGATDVQKPGVFLERPYAQRHPLQAVMSEAHVQMLREIARELGAEVDRLITVKKTRNYQGGTRSDVESGGRHDVYTITPIYL